LLAHDEVATAWIGLTEDELYMFRIGLEEMGGGEVTYSFLDEQPTVIPIDSWQYDPGASSKILILLRANPTGIAQLSGDIVGTRMHLWVSRGDWKRKVSLRQEADLVRRWDRLRAASASRRPK
jgi:hypothetical protein